MNRNTVQAFVQESTHRSRSRTPGFLPSVSTVTSLSQALIVQNCVLLYFTNQSFSESVPVRTFVIIVLGVYFVFPMITIVITDGQTRRPT
ncbi:hypothetical protein RvY_06082 [Ramazzottius varieornatus]|uniref:Uncharacterized protein n=1 Tax=Ramazzottius varieornatus TaxID=947166 RepID=A0A1D1V6Z8_RAMVA|nr:hypothetical protein RvY_06082 [Ramazzottius varieornatus]